MRWSPSFECHVDPDGDRHYVVGHELVDEFLEFVAARSRANTVRAYAHDLCVFFSVVAKDPDQVTTKDVLSFVTAQRRGRPGAENVVRIADGGAGLSAATIKRRLAAVSSFYGYLITRADTVVAANPVPRGISSHRSRSHGARGLPLVRGVRRLPRVLDPDDVEVLMGELRTERDRAMVQAMVLGGLRRCEVLGLRLGDLRLGEWRVLITQGKGGHERLVPLSPTFFSTVARYMDHERPDDAATDAVFVALKGRRRGQPLSAPGLDEILRSARQRAGLGHGTCHELRHTCFTRLRQAGMAIEAIQAQAGHRSINSTGLLASGRRVAGRRVPPGGRGHRGPGPDGGAPMSAALSELAPEPPRRGGGVPEITWEDIGRRAPQMVATMASYLEQLAVSARPATVAAVDLALRLFAGRVTDVDPSCRSVAAISRAHVEDFTTWRAARPGRGGKPLAPATRRQGLSLLRTFFERIIEYGYDDAPARVPIYQSDFPAIDEPLPKFLDDPTAAAFMAALAADPNPRRRLMVELLARTGMRSGELSSLDDDAMVRIGDTHWLRIPVGKLHNDRYVPLLPTLVELIDNYRQLRGPSRSGRLVERDNGTPFDRRTVHRYVAAVAKRAGVGHVHPHQLRHTLATQAVNRGMSLEAIATLLGHRSMDMTLVYARISDRTVADEYFRVTETVEANYGARPLAADGTNMRKLAADHRRLLGNGHCTRPKSLDCAFETACERCGFFETGPQFVTILRRQRDHSAARGQDARTELFSDLVRQVTEAP